MNVFAQTQLLSRLTAEIRSEATKYTVAPPANFTSERDMVQAKISRWKATVAGFEKSLTSRSHLNEVQYENARFSDHRFSAGQRHKSNAANIARVRSYLTEATRALMQLIEAINPDFEQAVLELLGDLMDQTNTKAKAGTSDEVFFHAPVTGKLEASIQQYVEPYRPANEPQGGGMFAVFYTLCFLTMLALKKRKS